MAEESKTERTTDFNYVAKAQIITYERNTPAASHLTAQ